MAKATILLVEDSENDALFMTMALEQAKVGHPVQVARDGREALDYLQGTGRYSNRDRYPLPCLVLLDLKLPVVMGLDVLRWIRQKPEFDSTVVLVLTSSEDPRDIEAAYHLKANAYLVKPSGLHELEALARSIKDFWLIHNQPGSRFKS